jgi:hypothetical protein
MLMTTNLIGFGAIRRAIATAVPAISLAVVATATSSATTITVPDGVQAGDVILLVDKPGDTDGSLPVLVVPTDFTTISSLADGFVARQVCSYKIANGTEGLSVLTGMAGQNNVRKSLLIIRPSAPATAVTIGSLNGEGTGGDPTLQTVTASGGTPALIVIAAYGNGLTGSITPRTFSPAPDGEITPATNQFLAWKIYNQDPVNVSVDMEDEGTSNTLASFYMQFSASPDLTQIAPMDHFVFSASGSYSETADFGSPASDRLVAVAINGANFISADGIDSVTIGGVAATLAVEELDPLTLFFSSIYWALVPSGSSGSVALTFTGDDIEASVDVYKITGADTSSPVAATADATVASGTVSASITPTDNSATLATALAGAGLVASPVSNSLWTNATEGYDLPSDPAVLGVDINWTSAYRRDTASPGSVSISVAVDDDTGAPNKTLAIAVFD